MYVPVATATSGLPTSVTIAGQASSVCSIAGGSVKLLSAGTVRAGCRSSGRR